MNITSDNEFAEHRWYTRATACSVLEDMRTCCKTLNFGPLPALIEELQMMVNRMENKLEQMKDLERIDAFLKERREELDLLRAEFTEIREATGERD